MNDLILYLIDGSFDELQTHGLNDQKFNLSLLSAGNLGDLVKSQVSVIFGKLENKLNERHDPHFLVQNLRICV